MMRPHATYADSIASPRAVKTYESSGQVNLGFKDQPGNIGAYKDLIDQDVTMPGVITIPVCSPERAFKTWNSGSKPTDSDIYPCNIPIGKSSCADSTFVDQTSNASPKVEDCRQLIRNIEGTGASYEPGVGPQSEIARHASCKFGVTGKVAGNLYFHVEGQDIIDIINDSINKFGGSGKVGAKGKMRCSGNTVDQSVDWGLY